MGRIKSRTTIHVRIKRDKTTSNRSWESKPARLARSSGKTTRVSKITRYGHFSDGHVKSTPGSNRISFNLHSTPTIIMLPKESADQTGLPEDHHRNKKTKTSNKPWSKLLIVGSLITLIAFVIILSVTLGLVLTKKVPKERIRAPAVLQWNTTGVTVAGLGSGGGTRALGGPHGFTWDSTGMLYIVEIWSHQVVKWKPEAVNGTAVAGVLNVGSNASNTFRSPTEVLVEADGGFYVADGLNQRLQYWPSGSSSGITVAGVGSNTSFALPGPFNLVPDPTSDSFFISVTGSASVVRYPSGATVAGRNGAGNALHQLNSPEGLVYDHFTNSLIIANRAGHNIARWTLGATNGTLLFGTPGTMGNTSNTLMKPMGLAMDPMGNIYVADYSNHRVQLFLNGETVARTIIGMTGVCGSSPSLLCSPISLKLDNQLNLFVSDHLNQRIQKFSRY